MIEGQRTRTKACVKAIKKVAVCGCMQISLSLPVYICGRKGEKEEKERRMVQQNDNDDAVIRDCV